MKYICKAISYVLHPIIMPMVAFAIMFEFETTPDSLMKLDSLYHFPVEVKEAVYLVMSILTLIAPGISLLIMYWNRMITDIDLSGIII